MESTEPRISKKRSYETSQGARQILFDDETETEVPYPDGGYFYESSNSQSMKLHIKKLIQEVYEDIVTCNVRINKLIDDTEISKPQKACFGVPQKHFMSEPL